MPEVIIFERDNDAAILISRALRGIKYPIGFDRVCNTEEEAIKAIYVECPKIVIISSYMDDEVSKDIFFACLRRGATIIVIESKGTFIADIFKKDKGNFIDREDDLSKFKIKFDLVYAVIKKVKSKIKDIPVAQNMQLFIDDINGFKVKTVDGFKYRKPCDLIYSSQKIYGSEAHFIGGVIYHSPLSNTNVFKKFCLDGIIKINQTVSIQVLHISVDDVFNLNSILMECGKLLFPAQSFIDFCITEGINDWTDFKN
jgi:hypothetical protein